MFTVATAAEFAAATLVEAETNPLVWHDVATVSEAIYVLGKSKRQANQDLAAALRDAAQAYFSAR